MAPIFFDDAIQEFMFEYIEPHLDKILEMRDSLARLYRIRTYPVQPILPKRNYSDPITTIHTTTSVAPLGLQQMNPPWMRRHKPPQSRQQYLQQYNQQQQNQHRLPNRMHQLPQQQQAANQQPQLQEQRYLFQNQKMRLEPEQQRKPN